VVTGKRNHFSAGTILYKSIPRVMHTIDGRGAELMRVLAKECRERGIEVLTNTPKKNNLRRKRTGNRGFSDRP
jgi:hypothetical protein